MKLFVAKLPQNVTSERLKAMFESYGSVIDAKVITDRDTGMSKCYGFVEMATEEAARDAIDRRSSGARPGGDRWGGGGGDDRNRSSNRYQDDRPKKRYDDDFDDKPRRKRI